MYSQREREKREKVGTVYAERKKYITVVFGREREKREIKESRPYSLKTGLYAEPHKREKFWRERKSKPIMKGYYDRVT